MSASTTIAVNDAETVLPAQSKENVKHLQNDTGTGMKVRNDIAIQTSPPARPAMTANATNTHFVEGVTGAKKDRPSECNPDHQGIRRSWAMVAEEGMLQQNPIGTDTMYNNESSTTQRLQRDLATGLTPARTGYFNLPVTRDWSLFVIIQCAVGQVPTTPAEIGLTLLRKLPQRSIKSIGILDKNNFLVGLYKQEYKDMLMTDPSIQLQGGVATILEVSPSKILITLTRVHGSVEPFEISARLKRWGKALSVRKLYFSHPQLNDIETDKRQVIFQLHPSFTPLDLPQYITVDSMRIPLFVSGRPPTCNRCNKSGHIVRDCPWGRATAVAPPNLPQSEAQPTTAITQTAAQTEQGQLHVASVTDIGPENLETTPNTAEPQTESEGTRITSKEPCAPDARTPEVRGPDLMHHVDITIETAEESMETQQDTDGKDRKREAPFPVENTSRKNRKRRSKSHDAGKTGLGQSPIITRAGSRAKTEPMERSDQNSAANNDSSTNSDDDAAT